MSRVLILIPFLLWLSWTSEDQFGHVAPRCGLATFIGFYLLLVAVLGLWGRWLARQVSAHNFYRSLRRFNFVVFAARLLVPAWFAIGMFVLGWAGLVDRMMGEWRLSLPGVVLGTLPAFLAWMGLWWAQYPADRALREQNLLAQLEEGLPLHAPPTFRSYFVTNLRLQVLFMAAPVLLVVLLHDLGLLTLRAGVAMAHVRPLSADFLQNAEAWIWIGATVAVFMAAPEILRRVLHTEPLPDGPLRRRLDAMCRRHGVRYREILLWRTEHNLGNAAVMGFVPRVRYILLSDLLLETMTDEQIEAVFAHELGHIVHRHMGWYVVFMVVLVLLNVAVGQWIDRSLGSRASQMREMALSVAALAKFLILFGFLSRRFERQADVFAARMIESGRQEEAAPVFEFPEVAFAAVPAGAMGSADAMGSALALAMPATLPMAQPLATPRGETFVGAYGAALFSSALDRVARVNNIPVAAPSWCHGSIAKRMSYLRRLSADPALTARFDRVMLCIYGCLLFALCASAALFALSRP